VVVVLMVTSCSCVLGAPAANGLALLTAPWRRRLTGRSKPPSSGYQNAGGSIFEMKKAGN